MRRGIFLQKGFWGRPGLREEKKRNHLAFARVPVARSRACAATTQTALKESGGDRIDHPWNQLLIIPTFPKDSNE